ncbi:MAG: hypothetical protein ABIF85_07340 [Nanoarchaeota archaeon]|nr:hypothetical protein [Nanoarchaeota archaeon]MBU4299695.1 hypothetical protein [Nanoarchaeota archaeon]MBU4451205.1 hypothetical protein [Nanoarchaeota archaeon]MCG2723303.1 hypothetical protein [archaeon]
MSETITITTVYPFLFIIASGYVTLLWGYRDAGLLNHFYDGLKEFDKAVQTTLTGVVIYIAGYYLSPNTFIGIFTSFPIKLPDFFAIAAVEVFLILVTSSFAAAILRKIHKGHQNKEI